MSTMRKNHKAQPAKLPDVTPNIAFNTKDKHFFYKILSLIAILFSFALIDIFSVNAGDIFNLFNSFIEK